MGGEKKTITNCYLKESRSGIGDFLRGSIYLYEYCVENNIEFNIDISHHPLSQYLKIDNKYSYKPEDVECLASLCENDKVDGLSFYQKMSDKLSCLSQNDKKNLFLFSNFSETLINDNINILPSINNKKLSQDCVNWFSSKIKFGDVINKDVESFLKELNLLNKEFHIVHLRLGDDLSFFNRTPINHFDKGFFPDNLTCFNICQKIQKSLGDKPLLVLSDNNNTKKYIKIEARRLGLPIYVAHLYSSHTQENPSKDNDLLLKTNNDSFYYTSFDAKLISLSTSVRCFSVYFWGSGFSSWVSKIFNKPTFCRPFIKFLT